MQCNVRRCCLRTREADSQTVVVTRSVTCHVYQSGTRTMEYILCSGPPALVLTLLSHNISNPLPPGVRDPEIWMLRK